MKAKGLTLVELLGALLIGSIILFQVLPAFGEMLSQHRSKAIAYDLIGLTSIARQAAISHGQLTTLCGSTNGQDCDGGWSEGILVFTDQGGMGTVDGNDKIIRYTQVITEGNISWSAFRNPGYIQFQENGFTNYHNGSLRYCPENLNAKHAKQLILNVAGRVRIAPDLDGNGIPNGTDGEDISC